MIDLLGLLPKLSMREALALNIQGNPWAAPRVAGCMKLLPIDRWLLPKGRSRRNLFDMAHVRVALEDLFGEDLHLARVRSMANGVVGIVGAAVVSIAAIGRAYARLAEIESKSGIKQVNRLLSNDGLVLDELMPLWIQHVVGTIANIVVAMDWTDFDDDDHTTLCVYLVTTHGRATPLAWRTVKKSTLKNRRPGYELDMVKRIHSWLPAQVHVTLLADRGFGYARLHRLLEKSHWDLVLRFQENIFVTKADGTKAKVSLFVPPNGRAIRLIDVKVTGELDPVPAVVLVKRKNMKEAWCLATSLKTADANDIIRAYSRRFSIEETFRDTKDITFGLGLRATHIGDGKRRDRLLFLIAIAHTLLTLLGAASEASGLDRTLKANTSPKRTMSLFNQGLYWYSCLPNMRDDRFDRLMTTYDKIVREHKFLGEILKFELPLPQQK